MHVQSIAEKSRETGEEREGRREKVEEYNGDDCIGTSKWAREESRREE